MSRASPSAAAAATWRALPLPPPRLLLVPLLALALAVPQPADATSRSYDGWRVLRARPSSSDQLAALERRVRQLPPGAGEVWRRRPHFDVLLRPDALAPLLRFLRASGISATVLMPDLGREIRRERSAQTSRSLTDGPGILDHYLRYNEIQAYLAHLAVAYPNFVSVSVYGTSFEGRPLRAIRISTTQGQDLNKPVILVDAGIHAREWIAPAMALYVIQQLVENPENADLIANVDWHIIPSLNPDGYEYSHTEDRMWRKTRSVNADSPCLGSDPNRNFDHFWGVTGVSWNPCTDIYAGSRPFSEAETIALANYALSLKPRIRLYVSVHSYGGVFIYPWGYSYNKPEDYGNLETLGKAVASAVMAAGIPSFGVGNCYETLGELAAGGSDDWMKAVAGANYSYTLEMPVPSFTTPPSTIPNYVIPTFEGFRVMGKFIETLFADGPSLL